MITEMIISKTKLIIIGTFAKGKPGSQSIVEHLRQPKDLTLKAAKGP